MARDVSRGPLGGKGMRRLQIKAGEPPLHEAGRLQAWARADLKSIKVVGREPVAPEGWPPGVDGDEEIDRFVCEIFDGEGQGP